MNPAAKRVLDGNHDAAARAFLAGFLDNCGPGILDWFVGLAEGTGSGDDIAEHGFAVGRVFEMGIEAASRFQIEEANRVRVIAMVNRDQGTKGTALEILEMLRQSLGAMMGGFVSTPTERKPDA